MTSQKVVNNPLGSYPVIVDRNANFEQRQAVGIDIGTVTAGVLSESRVSATNPLPVTGSVVISNDPIQNIQVSPTNHLPVYCNEFFGIVSAPVFSAADPITLSTWTITSGAGNVIVTSSVLPTGAATEASLADLDSKVVVCDTSAVKVTTCSLPTGAATETTVSSINAKISASQALSDSMANPTVGGLAAHLLFWDSSGSRWGRVPGSVTNGILVNTELSAAAALADATANPTTSLIGSCLQAYNGASWDRLPGDKTNGLKIHGSVASASTDSANPVKIGSIGRTSHITAVTNAQVVNNTANVLGFTGVSLFHNNRSDTFTTTANGVTIGDGFQVFKFFSIQVTATGAVTSWTVVLEGTLDNNNFTTILSHTNLSPGDKLVLSTTNAVPVLYFRARCSSIVLGGGTNVVAQILGIQ